MNHLQHSHIGAKGLVSLANRLGDTIGIKKSFDEIWFQWSTRGLVNQKQGDLDQGQGEIGKVSESEASFTSVWTFSSKLSSSSSRRSQRASRSTSLILGSALLKQNKKYWTEVEAELSLSFLDALRLFYFTTLPISHELTIQAKGLLESFKPQEHFITQVRIIIKDNPKTFSIRL